ncbi:MULTISPECIES: hypothetical protein [unclassified Variovorax]|uniref:hypothetical protein n=1 Tax=unclassified Variovorax TaxID=663243 RepID=UPI00076BF224|nr:MULTISPECIES: hypothetical protein [unclassified Variovorax]KWT94151.1 hypothetical protein APY03_2747 [Variovorax sp. WDL1]PNG59890.1 hypothetical protein CHC07_01619 [Variovorax sp. B4]PNG60319.1 hypothetical protein CHC06_00216 [Variovorax sp. B2]VTV13829.1 hypothetical protein WDL1CHR_04455 [Variovorax sp. WDL1]
MVLQAFDGDQARPVCIGALIACLALSDYDRSVKTLRQTFDVLSLKRSRPPWVRIRYKPAGMTNARAVS